MADLTCHFLHLSDPPTAGVLFAQRRALWPPSSRTCTVARRGIQQTRPSVACCQAAACGIPSAMQLSGEHLAVLLTRRVGVPGQGSSAVRSKNWKGGRSIPLQPLFIALWHSKPTCRTSSYIVLWRQSHYPCAPPQPRLGAWYKLHSRLGWVLHASASSSAPCHRYLLSWGSVAQPLWKGPRWGLYC